MGVGSVYVGGSVVGGTFRKVGGECTEGVATCGSGSRGGGV